jgi:archaemetzincin
MTTDYVSNREKCEKACGYQTIKGEQCYFKNDLKAYKWRKTDVPEMKWFKEVSEHYQFLPKALEDEWLSCNREKGQTFQNYISLLKKSKGLLSLNARKSTIDFHTFKIDENVLSDDILNGLREFIEIYFDLEVKLAQKPPPSADGDYKIRVIRNDTIKTERALSVFKGFKNKSNACIAAITTHDLAYQDHFVFGISDNELQVCVVSVHRYVQHLIENNAFNDANLLKKAASVICHEIAHAFGLEHCIYYRCIMNGSNTLDEDDKLPLYLCPICLKKLHLLLNFSIEERYDKLKEFCLKNNFKSEYDWYKNRLDRARSML